jgi:hypothetical protein
MIKNVPITNEQKHTSSNLFKQTIINSRRFGKTMVIAETVVKR